MKSSNVKLVATLGVVFSIVLVLTAAAGGFAIHQLGQTSADTENLADHWLTSAKLLGDIRATHRQFRRAEARMALSSDSSEAEAAEQQLEPIRKTLTDWELAYEPLLRPGAEQQAYEQYKAHRDAHESTHAKLRLLAQGGEKAQGETKAYFAGESARTFSAVLADIQSLLALRIKASDEARAAGQAARVQSGAWVIALVMGEMAIASLLAAWITQLITRPRVASAVPAGRSASQADVAPPIRLDHEGGNAEDMSWRRSEELQAAPEAQSMDASAHLLRALREMKDTLAHIAGKAGQNAEDDRQAMPAERWGRSGAVLTLAHGGPSAVSPAMVLGASRPEYGEPAGANKVGRPTFSASSAASAPLHAGSHRSADEWDILL